MSAQAFAGKPADADNFYQSGSVTVQNVTFPNKYRMIMAGNLYLPKLWIKTKTPRNHRQPSHGRGEGTERESLRHQKSRTRFHYVKGASHVDLYERVNLIPFDKLADLFTQYLN